MTLAADPEQIARRQAFRRRAFANREVAIGGAIVLLFVLVAVLAPLLAP